MIVYNVQRRFFALKSDADAWRIAQGLKPAALRKLVVDSREDLAALLDALAEPTAESIARLPAAVASANLIDDTFIPPDRDIPTFLREGWAKHRRQEGGLAP